MTPEQKLDRLERIVKLFVKAGLRARSAGRQQDENINMLINTQIRNGERFTRFEQRFAEQSANIDLLIDLHMRNEERLSALQGRNEERFAQLAESQASTDRRLESLIDIIRQERNGH